MNAGVQNLVISLGVMQGTPAINHPFQNISQKLTTLFLNLDSGPQNSIRRARRTSVHADRLRHQPDPNSGDLLFCFVQGA
jgi:hypothetical protein